MKFNKNKRNRSTFLMRLILYFLLIVTITLLASGYLTYNFFSSSFKGEITTFNNTVLKQLSIFSDDFLFKTINQMILNLAMEDVSYSDIMKAVDNPLKTYPGLIYNIHDKLSSLVASNNEFIDSISIHSKKNNLLITSHFVKNLNEEPKYALNDLNWIRKFYELNQTIHWFDTYRTKMYSDYSYNENDGNIITVACTYPLSATGSDIEGCIAFNIKEKAINNYLMMYNSSGLGQLMILDNKGTIISHSDKAMMYTDISKEPYVLNIINSKKSNSFETVIDKDKYAVSFIQSKNRIWNYVSIIPTKLLYQKNYFIKKNILMVSTAILFIVFILSNILSFKIYLPFRKILDKYTPAFNDGNNPNKKNEYQLLEYLFSNASNKIDNFKNILKKNAAMIRHNFLIDILHKRLKNPDSLKDIIDFTGMDFNKHYFSVIFLTFSNSEVNHIQQHHVQYIKYSMMDYIGSIERADCCLYPVDIGSTAVAVIANSDKDQYDMINHLVNDIEMYCFESSGFYLTAGTGRFVNTPFDINLSYSDARKCILYKFLKPAQHTFFYENISAIIQNTVPPEERASCKLRKSLNLNNINEIETLLLQFLKAIEANNISYYDVKKEISRQAQIYMQYLTEKNISLDDIADEKIKSRLSFPSSINEYAETFLHLIKSSFAYSSNKKLNKNSELVEKAKQYVLCNLHLDLSLTSTAQAINVSAYHFSRTFKEETGTNYIDYVINCKIEKAKELLNTTSLSIDEVTRKIGYSHSTYFSRKFKEITGITPMEFRTGNN